MPWSGGCSTRAARWSCSTARTCAAGSARTSASRPASGARTSAAAPKLAAFVAPEEAVRQKAAAAVGRERFLVVHLDAPLEVCRQRDSEGHYRQADSGDIAQFPGVSSPYEPPAAPDIVLATDKLPVDQCVVQILDLLESRGVLG
jgi:adenylylsulfate kinase-like enzyme